MRKTRASLIAVGLALLAIGTTALGGEPAKPANPAPPAPPAQPAQPRSPLEGTTWQVHVLPDKEAIHQGEKEFDDTIIFKAGKVSMSECVKYGFEPSKYSTAKNKGHLSFKTDQMSKDQGKNTWTADIMGAKIAGKVQWTKPDGTIVNYTFDGAKAE